MEKQNKNNFESFSQPLAWVVIFYAAGIIVQKFFVLSLSMLCLVFVLFFTLSVFLKKKMFPFFLFLLFLFLGAINFQNTETLHKNDIFYVWKYYYQKPIQIKGIIWSNPEEKRFFKGKKVNFYLKILENKSPWGWKRQEGLILVSLFEDLKVEYGDLVEITGRIHKPFEFAKETNFSYERYLKIRGIRLIVSVKKNNLKILEKKKGKRLKSFLYSGSNRFKNIFYENLSYNEAGILSALLLGDRSNIPKHVRKIFVNTGTAHVLAISGLHVGIVAGLFLIMLKILHFPRNMQFVMSIFLISLYAVLTGGRPSVIRATIMVVVFLMSFVLEREADSINSMCFAALILLVYNPNNIFDVGFQLSFLSVFSIFILTPKIEKNLKISGICNKVVRTLLKSFCISLSVWIGVLGIVAFCFNIITPITIFANLIVVPFISLIVFLGFLMLILGSFSVKVHFLALVIKVILNVMVSAVFLMQKIPFSSFQIKNVSSWHIIFYYLLIILIFFINYKLIYVKMKTIFRKINHSHQHKVHRI